MFCTIILDISRFHTWKLALAQPASGRATEGLMHSFDFRPV